MGIFGNIMNRIFHHDAPQQPAPAQPAPQAPHPVATQPAAPATPTQPVPSSAPAAPTQAVDVGAVLAAMAEMKGGGGNYQSSIVDLLKLLDLDSSLAARKELAGELGVHEAADGSAEQNIALHRAVMAKLAENGGIVPDSLRH